MVRFNVRKATQSTLNLIGTLSLIAVLLGCAYVIGRTIFHSPWVTLIVLIACPFMAFASKNGLSVLVYGIALLTVLCGVSVVASKGRVESTVKSIFLKGERKHTSVFVAEVEDDEGNITPEHYETEYYFEVAQGQPKILASVIEWGLLLSTFGIMVVVYLILKDKLG